MKLSVAGSVVQCPTFSKDDKGQESFIPEAMATSPVPLVRLLQHAKMLPESGVRLQARSMA